MHGAAGGDDAGGFPAEGVDGGGFLPGTDDTYIGEISRPVLYRREIFDRQLPD